MKLATRLALLALSTQLPAQSPRVQPKSFRGGPLPALRLDGARWFNEPADAAGVLARGPTLVVITVLW